MSLLGNLKFFCQNQQNLFASRRKVQQRLLLHFWDLQKQSRNIVVSLSISKIWLGPVSAWLDSKMCFMKCPLFCCLQIDCGMTFISISTINIRFLESKLPTNIQCYQTKVQVQCNLDCWCQSQLQYRSLTIIHIYQTANVKKLNL